MGLCGEFNDECSYKRQGEEDYMKTETEIRKMCL